MLSAARTSSASQDEVQQTSGCSVVWLTRLVWDQEIAGSNPVIPTAAQAALKPWSADTDNNADIGEDVVGIIQKMLIHRGVWRSWSPCLIWSQEIAGSNPVTPIQPRLLCCRVQRNGKRH